MPVQPSSTAIIILNYNGSSDTIECLRHVYRLECPPAMVIVVDNNSSDNSRQEILESWRDWAEPVVVSDPSIRLECASVFLTLPENFGYGGGNNSGIQVAMCNSTCNAFWILNNDTIPDTKALNALCARANKFTEPAIVGSTLVFAYDRVTVQCAAGCSFNRWLGTSHPICGGSSLKSIDRVDPVTVEAQLGDIVGASVLLPKEIVAKIGLIREDFFLYLEETEFCIRARKAGFTLGWAPDSIVYHKEGGSTGAESAGGGRAFNRPAWVDYLSLRNRMYMMRKHYPWALPVVAASYLGVMLNRIKRGQANRIPLIFRAAWDGLRGHMGKPNHLFPALRDVHENSGH